MICNHTVNGGMVSNSPLLSAPAVAVQAIQDVIPLCPIPMHPMTTSKVERYIIGALYHDNTHHKSQRNTMLFLYASVKSMASYLMITL